MSNQTNQTNHTRDNASAIWGVGSSYLFVSAPQRIGHTDWRVVVFKNQLGRRVVGYEFGAPEGWKRQNLWPHYDRGRRNCGLPASLWKLTIVNSSAISIAQTQPDG